MAVANWGQGSPSSSLSPEAQFDSAMQEKLAMLVDRLSKLATDQVQRKTEIEKRWLNNLRAFHGRYDEETEKGLGGTAQKSSAFVKITRKKCNSWEARLSALLFPTDEENWDIRPTPVPTLTEQAKQAVIQAQQQLQQANQQEQAQPGSGQETAQQAQGQLDQASALTSTIDEASRRAKAMMGEMSDQLIECDYAASCRMVIRDAVRLGTGILKGPLAGDHSRGQWVTDDTGNYTYKRDTDPAPIYKWVDPWSYFPDMSALRPEDREFEFERHLWSVKDLRRLVRERGFSKSAVRELIEGRQLGQILTDTSINYLASLRAITGTTDVIKDRFVGWEYHGPLSCEDISLLLRALGREEEAVSYEENHDPLLELRVICYFCEKKILKLAPTYPLDSNESLYSLFTFEESEASLFGYGIPEIMSDSQKSMNGAWRMALDNAALSVGPQVFVDRDAIEPANGSWTLTPRKVWYKRKGAGIAQGTVIETKAIENNVEEIMNLVEVSRRFIDDETALPVQAEGEFTDNPNITATATNYLSMGGNITFRRVVKNFDDGITVPSIRRLYDWNMQHNDRDDIKGDMKVDARGSGALLQRELQSQMLLNVAQNWASHPVLGLAIKPYSAIVEALRSAMIQPETLMVSQEQFDQAQQAQAQAQQKDPNEDPVVIAAKTRLEGVKIDAASRLQEADVQRDTEILKLAQKFNISIEELKTKLALKEMDHQHKEKMFTAEAAVEEELANQARQFDKKPNGSGGYISQ